MNDQPQPSIGTVAEEAARLITAMATMTRSSAVPREDPARDFSQYADGVSAQEDTARPEDGPEEHPPPAGAPSSGPGTARVCSVCGGENGGTPVACRFCPFCQGIALLRSVRPETVDRLADFASAVAASLRDVATQSRASDPDSEARSRSGTSTDRPPVQDIRVDDEDGG